MDDILTPSYRSPATTEGSYQEIQRVNGYRATLQDLHDSLPPVLKLPPEIVQPIFLFCVDITSTEHLTTAKFQNLRRGLIVWPGFSQTCRSWREIALGCPALWTQPRFDRPRMADEMLRRSGNMPKRIFADHDTSSARSGVLEKALAGHWGPVNVFHLCTHLIQFSAVQAIKTALRGSLQYLTLEQGERLINANEPEAALNPLGKLDDIAENLLGLRLILISIDLRISHTSFPRLTHLVLEDVSVPLNLFGILATAPLLERLLTRMYGTVADLKSFGPKDAPIQLRNIQLVRLSLLRPLNAARVLENIEIPPTACVHVDHTQTSYNAQVVKTLGSLACRHVVIKHLTSVLNGPIHTYVCRDEHLRTIARFTSDVGGWSHDAMVHFDAMEGLPLDDVESLVLRCDVGDQFGIGQLLTLPSLERIALVGAPSVAAFHEATTAEPSTYQSSDRLIKPILAAQWRSFLQTLAFVDAQLDPSAPASTPCWAELCSTVQQFIVKSRLRGAPLCTLILDNAETAGPISDSFASQGQSVLSVTGRRAKSLSVIQKTGGIEEAIEIGPAEFASFEWLYVKDSWSYEMNPWMVESENWCLPP